MQVQTKERLQSSRNSLSARIKKDFVRNRALYFLVLPVVAFYILFSYVPMFGIIIAFKDYSPSKGILGSPWTAFGGFKHFVDFYSNPVFFRLLRNTILLNLYSLIFSFPIPIVFALILNEVPFKMFKRTVQTISYFPHFVSLVVVCGIITDFTLSDGLINVIREIFGLPVKSLLQESAYYRTIYITSGIWQQIGWSSIIYLAAIAGTDAQLYEAAALDGAGRLKRLWHITLPSIQSTIVILFIMQIGRLMSLGADKTILLYNPSTFEVSDIISSFVYRRGLIELNWSFSSAVGLFNSIINFTLVYIANAVSRKFTENSLF